MIIVTKIIDDKFAIERNGRLENPEGGLVIHDDVVK